MTRKKSDDVIGGFGCLLVLALAIWIGPCFSESKMDQPIDEDSRLYSAIHDHIELKSGSQITGLDLLKTQKRSENEWRLTYRATSPSLDCWIFEIDLERSEDYLRVTSSTHKQVNWADQFNEE